MVACTAAIMGDDEPNSTPTTSSENKKEEPASTEETKKEEPKLSVSEENALKKANSYIDYMAFSKSGLIKQLEFDGFSKEDATKAVESIEVDWKEQAGLKAKSYLDTMSFSRSGLIKQLEFDGFTKEQANYGADQVGLK
ncbi:Ltp family lipoprotein [Hazenella sp. IB182357]|uniref:Ltp family lipoprotein n=2 Tax=Polycladospora coralii TaxID=2771432 RepID=A0A926RSD2_9BACL|nr:Ltp family lipoprotein [Polycladospora coralii]MBS7529919.1 Ltp family lipoprotein [Polycladospora coralii]